MNGLNRIRPLLTKMNQILEEELNKQPPESEEYANQGRAPDLKNPDKVIVLEVGHGPHPDGFEPGAVDPATGAKEWDLNRVVADTAASQLRKLGYANTSVTDENDYLFGLAQKNAHADIFVSCHHNAFDNPEAQGCEVLVHPEARGKGHEELANLICQETSKALDIHNRGVKDMSLGILSESTYLRAKSNKAMVLIEPYFITGSDVTDHEKWSGIAGVALAQAIHQYLS